MRGRITLWARPLGDRLQHVRQAQEKHAARALRESMRTYGDEHKELLADDTRNEFRAKVKGG